MRIYKQIIFYVLILSSVSEAFANVKVITTTTDLRSVVSEIGKGYVEVESLAKGTQDTHFIEAKPSFMPKVHLADLVVSVGLELEVGWLPSIISGARNPKVNPGGKGYLEVGPLVEPLDVPKGKVSRADGDVHPSGNPHFNLDPIRMGEVAVHIAKRLSELDPPHAEEFLKNAKALQTRLQGKTKEWQTRIEKSGVKKVVTYHKTLTYFLDRFHIENTAILEPKPGIPPTSGHILEVIKIIKDQKIPLILVENFFDPTVTQKIKQDVPSVRSATVAVAVDGDKGISTVDDLYEHLVRAFEGRN